MTVKIEAEACQHCMNCRVAMRDDTLPAGAYRGKETYRAVSWPSQVAGLNLPRSTSSSG